MKDILRIAGERSSDPTLTENKVSLFVEEMNDLMLKYNVSILYVHPKEGAAIISKYDEEGIKDRLDRHIIKLASEEIAKTRVR